ncbi:unnamed protein product [Bursaphelenchus okinawaensis]|uniref:ATP synthase subunit b n=1 Tax=Bursaphelenchus okinawaensis TaxID=465554 RepID=A0A811LLF8_9BILA|nr:unnamed protein product [Bursaphelenchus okinawaensis]CAG9124014.1 unnamed protein product [Bursaphelenchus okinawaensis]
MSLSRFAPALRAPTGRTLVFVPQRSAHAAAPAVTKEDSTPGFFQKISYRFRGIPLPGETTVPKSMFDDIGKEFVGKPIPSIANYKEGPERDTKNFPYPERPLYPPKTRMLMIPDSWCTPFQKVTGTSGPYLFFGGVFSFYINKELFVFEEQAMMLSGWIALYLIFSRSLGYKADVWAHNELHKEWDGYKQIIADDLKDAVEFRKTSAAEAASYEAVKGDFPTIFKENLALQLEATYRKNVETVATELKRRIDYLKEVEATKRRFERDIFVRSISEGVQKAIDTNEGNIKSKYLDDCIAQIKNLKV